MIMDFDFRFCMTILDVESVIRRSLAGFCVFSNFGEAVIYFIGAGFKPSAVVSRVVFSKRLSFYDPELCGEEIFRVTVCEVFVDSGSDDYCYFWEAVRV